MFFTIVALVSLDRATLVVDNPHLKIDTHVVIGKPSTPTPTGIYTLSRAYSTKLKMNMLVFRKEGNAVWAIHPNLKSRAAQLQSKTPTDNRLSGGCVGIDDATFLKLWNTKQAMVLQVY